MDKYYIGCGNGYIEQQKDNSFSYTTVEANAYPFKTESAARNVMKCLPKMLTNRGLFIIKEKEPQTQTPEPVPASAVEKLSINADTLSEELQSLFGSLNGFSNTLISCWNNKQAYEEAVDKADKETLDLLHTIEFEKFDVVKGYRLVKQLQNIRKVRRQYKDNLKLIAAIEKLNLTPLVDGTLHEELTKFNTREYHQRVKQSMFDEAESTRTEEHSTKESS